MNKCTDAATWLNNLPVASVLDDIVKAAEYGPVVVGAPPGSGKTLLVPAAIHETVKTGEKLVLVQPRRFAARSIAGQIARIRQCRLGDEVGYRVRFDSKVSQATTLCVQTTGVLLRQCITNPSLSGVGCVVLDEFHERSLEMDLLIGLLKNLRETIRPDLKILVMSATLDADVVASYLKGATVIRATDRSFPVDITYSRHVGSQVSTRNLPDLLCTLLSAALRDTQGHILVFLPGVREIFAAARKMEAITKRGGCRLVKLFGDLPAEQQDEALQEDGRRKVILSTNIAETSVTISGVTAVLDSGLARQLQVSASTGLPQLQMVSISQASADQRAGRAGRTGPGRCWRLWDGATHGKRSQFDTPEVVRADLTQALLMLCVLQQADTFRWLEQPPDDALTRGLRTLEELGLLEKTPTERGESYQVTELGRDVGGLPVHPRLGILLLEGARRGVLREVAVAAALLTERDPFRAGGQSGSQPRDRIQGCVRSDVFEKVVVLQHFHAAGTDVEVSRLPPLHYGSARAVMKAADQYFHLVSQRCGSRATDTECVFREVFLTAYPDRLCRLRKGSAERGTMVGGRGVRLDKKSSVRHEEFFLAIDIDDSGSEVVVRAASAVDPQWLSLQSDWREHVSVENDLSFNQSKNRVEERRRISWHGLILGESPRSIDNERKALELLFLEAQRKPVDVLPETNTEAGQFLVRARWLQQNLKDTKGSQVERLVTMALDDETLVRLAHDRARGLRSFEDIRKMNWQAIVKSYLGDTIIAEINRLAPVHCSLQNGKKYRIEYAVGKQPQVSIRIQHLFGITYVPPIVDGEVNLVVQLLGPNNRPQQRTTDLQSFWCTTYPLVKKELKRRYPKNSWPDDPHQAVGKKKRWGKNG